MEHKPFNAIFTHSFGNLTLNSIIMVYNNGLEFKAIDLKIFAKSPIIYDKYYENDTVYNISVVHCPYSFASRIYFAKFVLSSEVINDSIILIDTDTKTKVLQFTGKVLGDDSGDTFYRRKDVVVMTLRNSLTLYPDYSYFVETDEIKQLKKFDVVLPSKYAFIVYGIEYLSSRTGEKKYSVVVSKYASSIIDNNYNYKDSGYQKYFDKIIKKLKLKSALVTPCYYFVWKKYYPNSKIVKI
jgi:hypothetical protein